LVARFFENSNLGVKVVSVMKNVWATSASEKEKKRMWWGYQLTDLKSVRTIYLVASGVEIVEETL